MTRALLQWSDVRPTLLRAVGRSGVEYRLYRIEDRGVGRWDLFRFPVDREGGIVSTGTLADMKALAEKHERDALGPAPEPQRIVWERLAPGHWRGAAENGRAYHIRKVTIHHHTLERFEGARCTLLDEGSLAAMKAAAQRDATEAARERANAEATPA